MVARDPFHAAFVHALVKDGWTVTQDPFRLAWEGRGLDGGPHGRRLLSAEKEGRKIAAGVENFLGPSDTRDLQAALGHCLIGDEALRQQEPGRFLYLAVREATWEDVFEDPLGQLVLEKRRLRLVVFDERKEVIRRWTRESDTAN
jgi:hypothetical protein